MATPHIDMSLGTSFSPSPSPPPSTKLTSSEKQNKDDLIKHQKLKAKKKQPVIAKPQHVQQTKQGPGKLMGQQQGKYNTPAKNKQQKQQGRRASTPAASKNAKNGKTYAVLYFSMLSVRFYD